MAHPTPLEPDLLRWRCPDRALRFTTTLQVDPAPGVLGQDAAVGALRFGLAVAGPGQNVFVRGLTGTGRLSLVRELLQASPPSGVSALDRVYVHNFAHPDRPQLLSLPTGRGRAFAARMEELRRFVRDDLPALVETPRLASRSQEIESVSNRETAAITAPFERRLHEAGFALAQEAEEGPPFVAVLVNGEPVAVDAVDGSAAEKEATRARVDALTVELRGVTTKVARIRKRAEQQIRRVAEEEVRSVLNDALADLRRDYPTARDWLVELVEDAARSQPQFEDDPGQLQRYLVNPIAPHDPVGPAPVVVDTAPTVQSLLGSVDPLGPEGPTVAPHLGIHAGSILRADGGCLVLDARDVLSEPGAWSALTRTLRTGVLELAPTDSSGTTQRAPSVRPEPIPATTKVVLIGDPVVYAALDEQFPDFADLFKVLADFDDVLSREAPSIVLYSRVLSRFANSEQLPPLTASAVQALCEHGARLAGQAGKLTARFGLVADVAREAAFLARQRRSSQVDRFDVEQAVFEARKRASLPARRFREQLSAGIIRLDVTGSKVGQVNGLAVELSSPVPHGMPLRITATVGPGTTGTVHVEREAELSGAIHTKGFYIVRGLLRNLLETEHPLAFDASVTHEQSYGGVDGDSASCAELVCILSALTRLPARQGLAITGAVDQLGNVEPVGGVNEKVEGWFDACTAKGAVDGQGVLIPAANAGDLMLRQDVVEACRAGGFSIYAIESVHEALELLLGIDAGRVLAAAAERAEVLWQATASPELEDPEA